MGVFGSCGSGCHHCRYLAGHTKKAPRRWVRWGVETNPYESPRTAQAAKPKVKRRWGWWAVASFSVFILSGLLSSWATKIQVPFASPKPIIAGYLVLLSANFLLIV